jgi:hypothetical protein
LVEEQHTVASPKIELSVENHPFTLNPAAEVSNDFAPDWK